jgi:hypothetical protein
MLHRVGCRRWHVSGSSPISFAGEVCRPRRCWRFRPLHIELRRGPTCSAPYYLRHFSANCGHSWWRAAAALDRPSANAVMGESTSGFIAGLAVISAHVVFEAGDLVFASKRRPAPERLRQAGRGWW